MVTGVDLRRPGLLAKTSTTLEPVVGRSGRTRDRRAWYERARRQQARADHAARRALRSPRRGAADPQAEVERRRRPPEGRRSQLVETQTSMQCLRSRTRILAERVAHALLRVVARHCQLRWMRQNTGVRGAASDVAAHGETEAPTPEADSSTRRRRARSPGADAGCRTAAASAGQTCMGSKWPHRADDHRRCGRSTGRRGSRCRRAVALTPGHRGLRLRAARRPHRPAPDEPRDAARLLVDRAGDRVEHRHVSRPARPARRRRPPGVNDTRVIPARLRPPRRPAARSRSCCSSRSTTAAVGGARPPVAPSSRAGEVARGRRGPVVGRSADRAGDGADRRRSRRPDSLALDRLGEVPLPPYIAASRWPTPSATRPSTPPRPARSPRRPQACT